MCERELACVMPPARQGPPIARHVECQPQTRLTVSGSDARVKTFGVRDNVARMLLATEEMLDKFK